MSSIEANAYPVVLSDGDEAHGVAGILATLLDQNFGAFPSRTKIAHRMRRPVAIYSSDTESACTITFGQDRTVISNGIVGKPSVTVIATVGQILDVSQLKMMAGGLWPAGFFTKRGLSVIGEIVRHKLVIKGLLTHTVTALRTIALVSVAQ